MRTLTQRAADWLGQNIGTEPINILIVQWEDNTVNYYADTNYGELTAAGVSPELGIDGYILELSAFESTPSVDSNSSSQSISVKLDATTPHLKDILDRVDIHKRPAKIAQWFKGIPLTDAFILFDGVINTPITWSEGDRTLQFDIVSPLEGREIGFSIEEGNFDYVPTNLVGKAWPYIMGTAFKVPALRIQDIPQGVSASNFKNKTTRGADANAAAANAKAVNDATQAAADARTIAQNLRNAASALRLAPRGLLIHTDHILSSWQEIALSQQTSSGGDAISEANRLEKEAADYAHRARQYDLEAVAAADSAKSGGVILGGEDFIVLANGHVFPQNVPTTVRVGGLTFSGIVSGGRFNIQDVPNTSAVAITPASQVSIVENSVATQFVQQIAAQNNITFLGGSQILLGDDSGFVMDYIACLDHCSVNGVWARRKFETTTILWPVPSSYYVVTHVDYGVGVNAFDEILATKITMVTPLSTRIAPDGTNEGWEDDIFVDLTSPYGANPVVHIKRLIQRYTTGGAWDSTSFDAVQAIQANFPIGCAILDRKNVLDIIKEMAFQMRCLVRYSNGNFYLKYLPLDYPYVDTIVENDVERGSLVVTCNSTESLVTKVTARFDLDYADNRDQKLIYSHNINKYGTHKQTYDFWMYNIEANVHKSAVFWMIRFSNTFKRVKFNTFLTKLPIETNDYVRVTLPDAHNGTVTGLVEECVFDSVDNKVTMTIWLPVRFGERDLYPFAMPAELAADVQFPTARAVALGQAGTGSLARGRLLSKTSGFYGYAGPRSPFYGHGSNFNANEFVVANYGVSDIGVSPQSYNPGLSPGDISRTLSGFQRQGTTVAVHQIKPVPATNIPIDSGGAFPAYVRSRVSGNIYNCDVYFQGMDGEPTPGVQVQQIALKDGDVIPAGTPVIVAKVVLIVVVSGIPTNDYRFYMQAPTWAASE